MLKYEVTKGEISVKNFEKISILKRMMMTIQELEVYYLELRKYEYDKGEPIKGLEIRKKIHPLLLELIKLERMLNKETLTIVSDDRTKTNRPIIYACTHIGGNDVQRAFEAIEDHAYLFIADLKGMYKDIMGLILHLNGAIICQNDDVKGKLTEGQLKEDKKIAKARAIELLNNNGNLLIYPEGAWNITPNLLTMEIYNGAIDMAAKTNSIIVPVAIEEYDKEFKVNIGANIDFSKKQNMDINERKQYLRDALASLKYEIISSMAPIRRSDIPENYEQQFVQEIMLKCPYGFTVEDIEKTRYHNKNITTAEEVFGFQKKLIHTK